MAVRVSVAAYVPATTVVGTFSARRASTFAVPVPTPATAEASWRAVFRPAAGLAAALVSTGGVAGRTTAPATTVCVVLWAMTFGGQPRLAPTMGVVVGPVVFWKSLTWPLRTQPGLPARVSVTVTACSRPEVVR